MKILSSTITPIIRINQLPVSVTRWHHAGVGIPDMLCDFYLVKNHKIVKTQQPPKLEKKEPLEFKSFFDVGLATL
jgi:hypothetical protein